MVCELFIFMILYSIHVFGVYNCICAVYQCHLCATHVYMVHVYILYTHVNVDMYMVNMWCIVIFVNGISVWYVCCIHANIYVLCMYIVIYMWCACQHVYL